LAGYRLVGARSKGQAKPEAILPEEAIDQLATRLRTPRQIQQHLTLVLEAGYQAYQTGEKPVSAEVVQSVLSRQIDDLKPTLTRHGNRLKELVAQFNARPAKIRALFAGTLDECGQRSCGTRCWLRGRRSEQLVAGFCAERFVCELRRCWVVAHRAEWPRIRSFDYEWPTWRKPSNGNGFRRI